MANTYIHSLPDAPAQLDPQAYSIIDYKNIYSEYTTAKVYLSSLSNFFISDYIISEEHLQTKRATGWVNQNSATMILQSLNLNNSGNSIFNILSILDNRNASSQVWVRNTNENQFAESQLIFQNSLTGSMLRLGTLGTNFNQVFWTIGETKNDGYLLAQEKNLVIGTQGSDKDLILFTGGPFIGNERLVAKGDGSGRVGINISNPNQSLTVNGSISSNEIVFSRTGNSNQWDQSYSYNNSFSSRHIQSNNFVESFSANIVFKTGSVISGPIVTTNALTGTFAPDELISRRYVDALVIQTNVSGNFIPSLYYTKIETDALLYNPYSVYSFVNTNSALDQEARTFVNNNSSVFLSLNTNINQTSGKWESVYSYVNQASAQEEDQTEVTNFVISNSARSLEVQSYVNNISSNIADLYSTSLSNSSLNLEARSFVTTNSAAINSNISNVNNNTVFWTQAYTTTQTYSAQNIDTNTIVNTNSANWNQSYTLYSGNSGSYTTYQYVNNGFLPLSGGNVSGRLHAALWGVGNSETVLGTLGTLSRKMEIFDINGTSLGFIPIYGSIS